MSSSSAAPSASTPSMSVAASWPSRSGSDPRVISMERTNARTLTATTLPEPIAIATVDVSFISLALVLGPIAATLRPTPPGHIVALVKPQFEAGRGRTDHGVVRDPAIHREVLERVVTVARETSASARAR